MLQQLQIKNLAIVDNLNLEFSAGMQVITGETGAGKSILLDALGLALGIRASTNIIGKHGEQAEVAAEFAVSNSPEVAAWLREHDFVVDCDQFGDDLVRAQFDMLGSSDPLSASGTADECVIRRIITKDGRSKSYINGHLATVAQLKELGAKLVNIHSQHQHLALLTTQYQRHLLDQYNNRPELLAAVQQEFNKLQEDQQEYQQLKLTQQQDNKLQLLNYQIAELETLNLQADEVIQLQLEHTSLARADDVQAKIQLIQNLLYGETITAVDDTYVPLAKHSASRQHSLNIHSEGYMPASSDKGSAEHDALTLLHKAYNHSKELSKVLPSESGNETIAAGPKFSGIVECIRQAILGLEEIKGELDGLASSKRANPQRLQQVEQRLSAINQAARKHKVGIDMLADLYTSLCTERNILLTASMRIAELESKIAQGRQQYLVAANKLSASRKQAAKKLASAICAQLQQLDLPNTEFTIKVDDDVQLLMANGIDEVEFQISTNPGQPPQGLKAIASGGELSRISLAIQVISAEIVQPPTLVFDEVDVGISGKTAEIVGNLLELLGKKAQLICITHLPQVASKGEHHFKVTKLQTKATTTTEIALLTAKDRIQEIARLLGGVSITPQAIANAEAMLMA